MTRAFSNLNSLFEYCSQCPICKENRNISFEVGPDDPGYGENDLVRLKSHSFKGDILELNILVRILDSKYNITFKINCKNNTFTNTIPVAEPLDADEGPTSKASKPELYFWVETSCSFCHSTAVESSEMRLNLLSKKIEDIIAIEREVCEISDDKKKYELEYLYPANRILISMLDIASYQNEDGEDEPYWLRSLSSLEIPITELDFSDKEKLISKIETLILFA